MVTEFIIQFSKSKFFQFLNKKQFENYFFKLNFYFLFNLFLLIFLNWFWFEYWKTYFFQ